WQEFNRRLLVRDSSLASQLLLIIALIFLYLFNLKKMPLADYPEVKNIISFFNLGMVGMIQLAIGMRFIFPHFSRQLNTLWLQFILPVKREELFRMHLRFYIVPVTLLGFFLVISSGLILNIYPPLFAVQLAGVLFLGPVTANLCYCMGIIFPLKKFENVSQIESSGGGVLCMLFGIFYLVLALGVLAFPVRLIFLRKFGFNPGLSVLTGGFPVFFMILQAFFYYPLRKFAFQKYSRYSL
ncbi:MAG TPA: hypothetical protein VJC03_05025, partial [bacterium]|nr:hypothetical protein [bacterium]